MTTAKLMSHPLERRRRRIYSLEVGV